MGDIKSNKFNSLGSVDKFVLIHCCQMHECMQLRHPTIFYDDPEPIH